MKRFLKLISTTIILLVLLIAFLYYGLPKLRRQQVVVVPLDSRPVNTQYLEILGNMANADVLLPPDDYLDLYTKPAQTAKIMGWMLENSQVNKFVISANELFNGGLIASREGRSYLNQAKQEQNFKTFLLENKKKEIAVLYVLPRHLPSQFTRLWEFTKDLTSWAELQDKLAYVREAEARDEKEIFNKTKLQEEIAVLEEVIPPDILEEYENLYLYAEERVNYLLNLAEEGLIDELVIGLDDTAPYGLNIKLYRQLEESIGGENPSQNVRLLHGADDLTMLMLAKMLGDKESNPGFDITYLTNQDAERIFPYEGIPLQEMITERIDYLQGSFAGEGAIQLVIHSQPADKKSAQEVAGKIRAMREEDNIIALADIAYTNRGDKDLLAYLGKEKIYDYVDSYAGWNTAGNSIGTVLAHSVLLEDLQQRWGEKKKCWYHHKMFQHLRILDDYIYQAKLRAYFNKWAQAVQLNPYNFGDRWQEANKKIEELLQEENSQLEVLDHKMVFPWPRSFEIKVEFKDYEEGERNPSPKTS